MPSVDQNYPAIEEMFTLRGQKYTLHVAYTSLHDAGLDVASLYTRIANISRKFNIKLLEHETIECAATRVYGLIQDKINHVQHRMKKLLNQYVVEECQKAEDSIREHSLEQEDAYLSGDYTLLSIDIDLGRCAKEIGVTLIPINERVTALSENEDTFLDALQKVKSNIQRLREAAQGSVVE